MILEIACECGKRYRVEAQKRRRSVPCRHCKRPLVIPAAPKQEDEVPMDAMVIVEPPAAPAPEPETSFREGRFVNPEIPPPRPGTWQTMASNPALLKLEVVPNLLNDPGPLISMAGMQIVAIAFLVCGHLIYALIASALGLAWLALRLVGMRRRLAYGCVTPAIVVGENPWRIAIYCDLTTGNASRDAIKIMRAPLDRMVGGKPEIGFPLACVNLYAPGPDADAWNDFSPTIIQLSTKNEPQIQRIMASIPASEWDALARLLPHVDVQKEGLYKLWRRGDEAYMQTTSAVTEYLWLAGIVVVLVAIAVMIPKGNADAPTPAPAGARTSSAAPARPMPTPTVRLPQSPSMEPVASCDARNAIEQCSADGRA